MKSSNPFAALAVARHAEQLARAFQCLHIHGHDSFNVECQLWAMLRFGSVPGLTPLSAYLEGRHFAEWQGASGEFEPTTREFSDLQELANEYLEHCDRHLLADPEPCDRSCLHQGCTQKAGV